MKKTIEKLTAQQLAEVTMKNLGADVYAKMQATTVAVAGLGGLGSVVASSLARAGIGKLIIADFDIVEASNLNRQQYFLSQIGMKKTDAMLENLGRMNPYLEIDSHSIKLDSKSITELFAQADIISECFDKPEAKQMIVETVLSKMPQKRIVCASGLAGFGRSNIIQTQKLSPKFILVGDCHSGIGEGVGLYAARVGIAANHQANAIIEMLINEIGQENNE